MKIDIRKNHESDNFNQFEFQNKGYQLLELPSLVISIFKTIEKIHLKQDAIEKFITKYDECRDNMDRYMTPQQAMDYLGFSKGTFDKYRYNSKVKIKGHQLEKKTWFKKSDLDRFMLTYQAKSGGLA